MFQMIFFSGAEVANKKSLQKLGTDRQIRRQGRALEHYFGPREREFGTIQSSKVQTPVFCPGGGWMLKFRIDRCIN